MTDYWESDGDVGIRPNVDRNIVPADEATNKDVGESDDRWENAYIDNLDASLSGTINSSESVLGRFAVRGTGPSAMHLISAEAVADKIQLATHVVPSGPGFARTTLWQDDSAAAIAVAQFIQLDVDQGFLDFDGAVAADCSRNISTGNGNGIVDGPKTFSVSGIGWNFARMIKIRIKNGEEWLDYWIPAYTCDTGH